jgi:serine/threonine-protein kinase
MGGTLVLRPERGSAPPAEDLLGALGLKVGDVLAGRYRVQGVLGSGGMGAVLATVHVQLGLRYAVKILRPQALTAPNAVERFVREARAASRLTSPHSVRIFDVGTLEQVGAAKGVPYMVMELLEGTDLKTKLRAGGPMDPRVAAEYVVQACAAVTEAHLAGIVHRDLKPSNLFLVESGAQAGTVKVLDFGISKFLVPGPGDDAPLTNPETTLGSPRYMAPEQLSRPNEVDERADVWSLGVTLYELLTGKTPFRGPSDEYVARAVMVEYPVPVDRARPDVPPALAAVVMRCLEKDRRDRYATAAALADALKRAIATAGPEPTAPTVAGPPETIRMPSAPPAPRPPSSPPVAHGSVSTGGGEGAGASAAHTSAPLRGSTPPQAYPSVPPPPPVPAFTQPPERTSAVPEEASTVPRRSLALPVALGAALFVALGGGLVWWVRRGPEGPAPAATGTAAVVTPSATQAGPADTGSVALSPLPVDTVAPVESVRPTPLPTAQVTGASAAPLAPKRYDPLCAASKVVCARNLPECGNLQAYCEGKARPDPSLSSNPNAAPGETPICTAARIVCDHKLEECGSLTKKCLEAQLAPPTP